jgi:hypothetical protein
MRRSLRTRTSRVLVGVLGIAVLVTGGWYAYEASRAGHTSVIRSSYAFDVSNRELLAGYADNVFVGRVEDIAGVDESNGPSTIFRVTVEDSLKGTLQGSVLVRQLGAKIGKDVWLVENDEQLSPGQTYVFATKHSRQQRDAQVLLAGTLSHQRAAAADRERVVNEWRQALGRQRMPENVPTK